MPEAKVDFFGVRSEEALAHLAAKVNMPSRWWDEYQGVVHGRGFMIAGATKAELLKDLHESMNDMLANGKTLGDFRKDFDKIVQKHGWTYKGKRGWRTKIIYNTNMRTARMAGRWQQIERNKDRRPYLKYVVVDDSRLRPQHRAWRDVVLPVDDSWWNTHYPPNGWGCRCTVRSLSERQLESKGLNVADRPDLNLESRTNTRTGEVYPDTPKGIDTGWDYNVGKAWLGADRALGQKMMELPSSLRDKVLEHNAQKFGASQLKSWQYWLKTLGSVKKPRGHVHSVALLKPKLINFLKSKGKLPASALVTVADNDVTHLEGGHKGIKKALPKAIINKLPLHLQNYKLALWDKDKKNIILVMDAKVGDKQGRAAVEINFKLNRGNVTNSVRSLGIIFHDQLKNKRRYEIIEGSW